MTKKRHISFGERVGAVQALTLPLDDVTPRFRNAVWNLCDRSVFAATEQGGLPVRPVYPPLVLRGLAWDKRWLTESLERIDEDEAERRLRKWVTEHARWYEVYEFLEYLPRWGKLTEKKVAFWERAVDLILSEEGSPYRFVNHKLMPITSEQERAAVVEATSVERKYDIAAGHVTKALAQFSARPDPDYENAAKEAASAFEAALNIANGKQLKVGDAVKTFVKTHSVHPALMESANNLFGYASDRDGVRHAKKGTSTPVDFTEAKLVIVSASAWVNFIAAKAP